MSSKDESFLNTGVNSATGKPLSPREVQREKKGKDLEKLKPAYELILEDLADEREKVSDLSDMIVAPSIPDAEIKSELLARKKYLAFINGLEARYKNIMKDADK